MTDGSVTVTSPPEGNPTYHLEDKLDNLSDHSITVKKVGTVEGAKFDLWFMNMNTCHDRDANDKREGLGSGWEQDHEETFTRYNLIRESTLEDTGGFATYANNRFRHRDPPTPPPDYATVHSDTNAFTVVSP